MGLSRFRRTTFCIAALLLLVLAVAVPACIELYPVPAPAPSPSATAPGAATPLRNLAATFEASKKASVIVLGSYSNTELPWLLEVRDSLRARGYDAELIKDLPDIQMLSNEEKVRLFTASSRFLVMVDRSASGHIAEYIIVREQRSILALLRPLKTGSTWMIGDDPWVDSNYIKLFEFEQSPNGVMDQAVRWAEGMAQLRASAYDKGYPWRKP